MSNSICEQYKLYSLPGGMPFDIEPLFGVEYNGEIYFPYQEIDRFIHAFNAQAQLNQLPQLHCTYTDIGMTIEYQYAQYHTKSQMVDGRVLYPMPEFEFSHCVADVDFEVY